MIDERELLERARSRFGPEPGLTDRIYRRRDRKRRSKRITAGIVGIAVFVAAVWIVRDVASLDHARPATQPTQTPTQPTPTTARAVGAVPKIDYLLDLDTGQMTPLPETITGDGYNAARNPREYATSPDSSRLAFSRPGDNGKPQIFVANLDGTGIKQVTHDVDAAYSPAWSPDASKIAYIGYHGGRHDVFVLDLATGMSTQLTFATKETDPTAPDIGGQWNAFEPSFTEDGSSIAYGVAPADTSAVYDEHEIRIVPAAGGESVTFMREPYSVRMSPDGSLSYGCGFSICIANADGSYRRSLAVDQWDSAFGLGDWSPDGTRIVYSMLHSTDVYVVDVATGWSTYVAEGFLPTWVDDHTLIVEMNHCYDPDLGARGGCGG
jgi:hypothetical protein